jgi:uncharacterized damage-inducible protein DinB
MTEKELFVKAMQRELPTTLKVLRAIPSGQKDFKPHERSQTAQQIIQTMIAEVNGMQNIVKGLENVFTPVETSSLENAIEMYEKSFADTLQTIKAASEEELEKPLEGMMGKFFPRRLDGLWTFANDTIHHRGQLSVYIRLAGGKVPSIYGPSADDNPFLPAA